MEVSMFFKKKEQNPYDKYIGKDITIVINPNKVLYGNLRFNNRHGLQLEDNYLGTYGIDSATDITFIQEGDHTAIEEVVHTSGEQDVELNRYKVTLILKENNEVLFIFDETIQKHYTGAVTRYEKKSVDDIISDFLYHHATKIPDDTHRFIAQGCIISASAKLIKGHTRKDKTYSSYTEKVRKLKGCVCKNETTTMATR